MDSYQLYSTVVPKSAPAHRRGYQFQTDYIIHTCGPVYAKEREEECRRDLANAYRNSLLKTQAGAAPATTSNSCSSCCAVVARG